MEMSNLRDALKSVVPAASRRRLRDTMQRSRHFGFRRQCPLCRAHVRAFSPYGLNFAVLREKQIVGGGYRDDVLCPICSSTDRERLVYLFLRQRTSAFTRPTKLLHVAPEGALSAVLKAARNVDYTTADLMSTDVMVNLDITKIPFPDHTFDAVICNHVLEHIPDDGKAMAELLRVLRRGGWGILQVPVSLTLPNTYEDPTISTDGGRAEAFGQEDHVRIYTAGDYQERLARAGFRVQAFRWTADPQNFGGEANRFGLNRDEKVYYVQSP